MMEAGELLERLRELSTAAGYADEPARRRALKEAASLLVALPWELWARDESAMMDRFSFFVMENPVSLDERPGAANFRDAAVIAARINPLASRLILEFPTHWTYIEIDDFKTWVRAHPPAIGIYLAERLSPMLAATLVPQPNVKIQLDLLEEIITQFPDARVKTAGVYRQWIIRRAEAGLRAATALGRTLAAVADMLRDDEHLERSLALVEHTVQPVMEEPKVREIIFKWVDDRPLVRAALAVALRAIYLDDAAPLLFKLVADNEPGIVNEALMTLGSIGEEGNYLPEDLKAANDIITTAERNGATPDLVQAVRRVFFR